MIVSKHIRQFLFFYGNYYVAGLAISIACGIAVYLWGLPLIFPSLLLKAGTSVLIYVYINVNKKTEFHYYSNLGYSKLTIWCGSLFIDLVLFILVLLLLFKLR